MNYLDQYIVGENLAIMEQMPKHCVDMIYMDPPFFKQRDFHGNVEGAKFTDTWPNQEAYLEFLRMRFHEIKRLLKPTGSLFLHVDDTMVHYAKCILDMIFGVENFANHLVWRRMIGNKSAKERFPRCTDHILFYNLGKNFFPEQIKESLSQEYIEKTYTHFDERGRWTSISLTGYNTSTQSQAWRGVSIGTKGWKVPLKSPQAEFIEQYIPGFMAEKDYMKRLDLLYENGFIHWTKNMKLPRLKFYLTGKGGTIPSDFFDDISCVNKPKYPTEKPVELIERLIKAVTKEREVVFDPFVGSGNTLIAAENLNRKYIGIDISEKGKEIYLENSDNDWML